MNDLTLTDAQLEQCIYQERQKLTFSAAKFAQSALLKELYLTPKPGLVDADNNGSHHDMNFLTFLRSIIAISPYLDAFYQYGLDNATKSSTLFLSSLRMIGMECEKSMLNATNNINTHKGAIFAFGLILAAMGRLQGNDVARIDANIICSEVADLCYGMVERELTYKTDNQQNSVGERLYHQYQLTGARGEAESGYSLVTKTALPIYTAHIKQHHSDDDSLLYVMLHLMSVNKDTNIISRGGIDGLEFVQQYAKKLINSNFSLDDLITQLRLFDDEMIAKNLSPGGTADLIAVTWFLSHYDDQLPLAD